MCIFLVLNCTTPTIGQFARQVVSTVNTNGVYAYGSRVRFECQRGLQFDEESRGFTELSGSAERSCSRLSEDGQSVTWDGSDYTCQGKCCWIFGN